MSRSSAAASTVVKAAATRRRRDPRQTYVSFRLNREIYALPITRVREIIGICETTPLPRMPPFVRGVINLRGRVIVVLDTRQRLNQASQVDDKRTCIIIVATSEDEQPNLMGLVVDRMSEVLNLPPDCMEAPADGDLQTPLSSIQALAKQDDDLVIILDVDSLTRIDGASSQGPASDHPFEE